MTTTTSAADFRVMDPEFAFIAANAAVEVDDIIHGRESTFDNVTRLSDLLKTSVIHEGPQGANLRSLMDPVSTDVFSRALSASRQHAVSSLNELATRTEELSEALAKVQDNEEMLEVLRDFCVALSKYALGTRHTLLQSRVRNPYKK